jgi:hypothetical protein
MTVAVASSITTSDVKEVLSYFIKSDYDNEKYLWYRLYPQALNPFLKCIEALGERIIVELDYDRNKQPIYKIKKIKESLEKNIDDTSINSCESNITDIK